MSRARTRRGQKTGRGYPSGRGITRWWWAERSPWP